MMVNVQSNLDTEVSLATWLTTCGATTEVSFLSNLTWYTCGASNCLKPHLSHLS